MIIVKKHFILPLLCAVVTAGANPACKNTCRPKDHTVKEVWEDIKESAKENIGEPLQHGVEKIGEVLHLKTKRHDIFNNIKITVQETNKTIIVSMTPVAILEDALPITRKHDVARDQRIKPVDCAEITIPLVNYTITIVARNDALFINGEHVITEEIKGNNYNRTVQETGKLSSTISLPAEINPNQDIQAVLEGATLKLTFAKAEPTSKIVIKKYL